MFLLCIHKASTSVALSILVPRTIYLLFAENPSPIPKTTTSRVPSSPFSSAVCRLPPESKSLSIIHRSSRPTSPSTVRQPPCPEPLSTIHQLSSPRILVVDRSSTPSSLVLFVDRLSALLSPTFVVDCSSTPSSPIFVVDSLVPSLDLEDVASLREYLPQRTFDPRKLPSRNKRRNVLLSLLFRSRTTPST